MRRWLIGIVLAVLAIAASPPAHAQVTQGNMTTQAANCGSSLTGTSGGTSSYRYIAVSNYGGATVTLSNTWGGTVSFLGTNDGGVNYNAIASLNNSGATTATGNGTWQFNPTAYSHICVAFTTASSGTVSVTIRLSTNSAGHGGGGGSSGAVSSVTGAGTVSCSPTTGAVTCTGSGGGGIGGTVSSPFLPWASGPDTLSDSAFGYDSAGITAACQGFGEYGIYSVDTNDAAEVCLSPLALQFSGLMGGPAASYGASLEMYDASLNTVASMSDGTLSLGSSNADGGQTNWSGSSTDTANLALHAGHNADGNGEFGIDANTGMDNDWLQFLTDGSTFTEFSVIFPTTGDECTSYLDGVDPAFVGCRQNNGMAEAYLQTDSGMTGTGRVVLADESGTPNTIEASGSSILVNGIPTVGTVSGQANGVIPLGTTATSITQQSHLDDGVTTAGVVTSTEPVIVAEGNSTNPGLGFAGNSGATGFFSTGGNTLYFVVGGQAFAEYEAGVQYTNYDICDYAIGTNCLDMRTAANGAVFSNKVSAPAYITGTNCSSSASPAVCGSAAAGSVALPTNAVSSSIVVDTTAVTANSQIFAFADDTLGTKLGVTCNSTVATLVGGLAISARTASTSFTIANNVAIVTNPLCVSYFIVN